MDQYLCSNDDEDETEFNDVPEDITKNEYAKLSCLNKI